MNSSRLWSVLGALLAAVLTVVASLALGLTPWLGAVVACVAFLWLNRKAWVR